MSNTSVETLGSKIRFSASWKHNLGLCFFGRPFGVGHNFMGPRLGEGYNFRAPFIKTLGDVHKWVLRY